jgi:hypothetical protein
VFFVYFVRVNFDSGSAEVSDTIFLTTDLHGWERIARIKRGFFSTQSVLIRAYSRNPWLNLL